eukprot:TRINITY_DN5546_c0_g1_i3.p1 TRINITY_DN5546_c0_g1~~TRINITY_DN5546_c0_g1_i3.p1  ORF type:complete len:339 (+),score=43.87 TRINITY_DN5546_c0_g1_i3:48-1064(+)
MSGQQSANTQAREREITASNSINLEGSKSQQNSLGLELQIKGCQEQSATLNKDQRHKQQPQTQTTSRRKQKKLEKKERLKQNRQKQKQSQKEERLEAAEEKKRRIEEFLNAMTEEEREEWTKQQQEKKRARYEQRMEKQQKMDRALEHGVKFVIDLDFEQYMSPEAIQSLCQQLSYSYSAVHRSSDPPHLHLTSVKSKVKETILKSVSGVSNWKATMTEKSFVEHFEELDPDSKGKMIYLSGDAEEEMKDIDKDAIYIVGGLVDSNRFQGMCEKKAKELGIKTMALPIGQYVQLTTSKILTVNHVIEILVKFNECRDWKKTLLETIPQRKIAKVLEDN